MNITLIGTGVMGKPMAKNLVNDGFSVSVFNRTYEKSLNIDPKIKVYKDIASSVKEADIIITIVGYPSDVSNVYDEIFKHAKKGAICIDMTTSSPKLAKKLYIEGKKHNLNVLDAPVTGSDLGAINKTLSIMVGGEENIYKKVLPVFKSLGKTITYMGEAGSGQLMKLTNQIVIASNIAGIAEALTFAKAHNLDLENVIKVINGGSASSWQALNNGTKMINNDYEPGFYVKHFLKDLKLIIDEKLDLDLKVFEQVHNLYEKISDLGYNNKGTQILYHYYINQV